MNCCTLPSITPEAVFGAVLIAGCVLYAAWNALMLMLGK